MSKQRIRFGNVRDGHVLSITVVSVLSVLGVGGCHTSPKGSGGGTERPSPVPEPSNLGCPAEEVLCTMNYAPVRCTMKSGDAILATVDADNSCRGQAMLNEKWCRMQAHHGKHEAHHEPSDGSSGPRISCSPLKEPSP